MNKLTKLFSTIFALTLLVALPVGPTLAADEESPVVHPLIAGQHTEIGTVSVFNDGTYLTVVFEIDETLGGGGYELLKTHVLADTKAPLKGAIATGAPGQFKFQGSTVADFEVCDSESEVSSKCDRHTILLKDIGKDGADADDTIYVAFHANVQNLKNVTGYTDINGDVQVEPGADIVGYIDSSGVVHKEEGFDIVGYEDSNGSVRLEPGVDADCPTLEEFAAALPGSVNQTWTQAGDGYFQTTISGDTNLDGTYTGWCIDYKHNAVRKTDANVYSSYGTLPDSLTTAYEQPRTVGEPNSNVDRPENLDLLNWLINNTQRPLDQQVSATNTDSFVPVPVSTIFLNAGPVVTSTKWDGVTTMIGPNVVSFDGTAEQIVLSSTTGLAKSISLVVST